MEEHLLKDVERIQSLDVVPTILELVCRSTGMGFSAVARVTEDKWITCAVKDDIAFGLKPGSELVIETTICNEIRAHHQPVVIDEVSSDDDFVNHHTPKMYGFQSYISIPIFLKSGEFFGTLCAIDPRPFPLKANNTVKMFQLYADLISFHLLVQEQNEAKSLLLKKTEEKLKVTQEDIHQYAHISQHTLQEPLRKLQLFSDMMITDKALPDSSIAKELALEINTLARGFSAMITELGTFSSVPGNTHGFQAINLNTLVKDTLAVLSTKIAEKNVAIDAQLLPTIAGIPSQIGRLFINLVDNAVKYSREGIAPIIKIYAQIPDEQELLAAGLDTSAEYYKICVEDNGIGIHKANQPYIFDLFTRFDLKPNNASVGMGLPQSRRIMRNHNGAILVTSEPDNGSVFALLFPKNTN